MHQLRHEHEDSDGNAMRAQVEQQSSIEEQMNGLGIGPWIEAGPTSGAEHVLDFIPHDSRVLRRDSSEASTEESCYIERITQHYHIHGLGSTIAFHLNTGETIVAAGLSATWMAQEEVRSEDDMYFEAGEGMQITGLIFGGAHGNRIVGIYTAMTESENGVQPGNVDHVEVLVDHAPASDRRLDPGTFAAAGKGDAVSEEVNAAPDTVECRLEHSEAAVEDTGTTEGTKP